MLNPAGMCVMVPRNISPSSSVTAKKLIARHVFVLQILANRAIAHSRLGNVQEARDDFLTALQAKVEPRHSIIEDALLCWQVSEKGSLISLLNSNEYSHLPVIAMTVLFVYKKLYVTSNQ